MKNKLLTQKDRFLYSLIILFISCMVNLVIYKLNIGYIRKNYEIYIKIHFIISLISASIYLFANKNFHIAMKWILFGLLIGIANGSLTYLIIMVKFSYVQSFIDLTKENISSMAILIAYPFLLLHWVSNVIVVLLSFFIKKKLIKKTEK